MATFYEFSLSETVVRATARMGFEETTSIQEMAIPVAMKGEDIIGQAQTGTGKTAAFAIPMLEIIEPGQKEIQGLVLAPTRELAVQVAEEINALGQFKKIRALPIYGGQDIQRQIKALKSKPEIIVATPGRLMDHMRRRLIRLQHLKTVVLDEADEMLNMGFRDDIETILAEVPGERQTMLFSATMPQPIKELAQRYMRDPEFIRIKPKEITVPNTEQYYYRVQEKEKFEVLCRLLDLHAPEAAIVFARTKRRVDELFEALSKRGYSAEAIHGDLTQSRRDSVMKKFKNGTTEILVATDVAARGLDIGSVTHIYNFDIPQDPENYVHRIGRTGRLGKAGIAATFASKRELNQLEQIERSIKRKIYPRTVPSFNEALEGQQHLTAEKLMQVIEAGEDLPYREVAREMLENTDSLSLMAAALKLLTKEPDRTPVNITVEEPVDFKSKKRSGSKDSRSGFRNKSGGYKGKSGRKRKHQNY
ncbi:MAG: DEAD/DEAH box helicase [Bacillota bacterium]